MCATLFPSMSGCKICQLLNLLRHEVNTRDSQNCLKEIPFHLSSSSSSSSLSSSLAFSSQFPAISSHFLSIPSTFSNIQPFPKMLAISSILQHSLAFTSHYFSFQDMSSHFQPFPDISNYFETYSDISKHSLPFRTI